jgi:PAS domain S-box-containing protein
MSSDTPNVLWRGQERFRGAFLHSGIGIALVSTEGKFLDVNPAFCRYVGYSEKELCAKDFQVLTHPDDLEGDLDQVTRMLAGEIETYSMEKRYRHKDGHLLWAFLSVSLVRDDEGHPVHFISQIQDVTERHRANEELRISRERLRLATSAGGIGTWDYDIPSGTLEWNDAAYAIYGVDPGSFQPDRSSALRFMHPEDVESTVSSLRECLLDGSKECRSEFRIVRPDGEIRYLRIGGEILRDSEGRPERFVGVIIDLTPEKRALDAARAADQAKSDFLAMMSHEIRTPMNGMLGFAALLRSAGLDELQRSYLDTIDASGQRLLEVIDDILDLSRIEAGSLPIEYAGFEVRACVRDVFELLRPSALKKELQYEMSIAPDVPLGMLSDRGRLAQILTNLLGNALKFTDHGFVRLDVSCDRADAGDYIWHFRVRDCGPGVPSEMLHRIFDPFFQASPSRLLRNNGSGLGLGISRHIAELLGGGIAVRNLEGGGAEFCATIRAESAEVAHIDPSGIAASLPACAVLVAEDNDVNRRLCGLQLRRLGCEPEFACTGKEAVEMARRGKFRAILMDVQLPELDGIDAARAIREEENNGHRVPIIAMTANAMPQDRAKCLQAGMDDYLSKPVRIEALGATLAKWLQNGTASSDADREEKIPPRMERDGIKDATVAGREAPPKAE